jgi:hypothetical protein
MHWQVVFVEEFASWLAKITTREREVVVEALHELSSHGPTLGRPFVDHIKGSNFNNLKELRPRGTSIRVLFIFDPMRNAVMLVGGDKSNNWKSWYSQNIKIAEERYRKYLKEVNGQFL